MSDEITKCNWCKQLMSIEKEGGEPSAHAIGWVWKDDFYHFECLRAWENSEDIFDNDFSGPEIGYLRGKTISESEKIRSAIDEAKISDN